MNFPGIGYNKNSQLCPYKDGYPNNCWDKKSRERYELWTDSIVNFYNSEAHQISETSAETTDSTRTLNENIADLIGIEMSFRAYKLHLDELETQGKQEKVFDDILTIYGIFIFLRFVQMLNRNVQTFGRSQDFYSELFNFSIKTQKIIKECVDVWKEVVFIQTNCLYI